MNNFCSYLFLILENGAVNSRCIGFSGDCACPKHFCFPPPFDAKHLFGRFSPSNRTTASFFGKNWPIVNTSFSAAILTKEHELVVTETIWKIKESPGVLAADGVHCAVPHQQRAEQPREHWERSTGITKAIDFSFWRCMRPLCMFASSNLDKQIKMAETMTIQKKTTPRRAPCHAIFLRSRNRGLKKMMKRGMHLPPPLMLRDVWSPPSLRENIENVLHRRETGLAWEGRYWWHTTRIWSHTTSFIWYFFCGASSEDV